MVTTRQRRAVRVTAPQRGSVGAARRSPARVLAIGAVTLVALTLVAHLSSPARHTLVVASMPYWNIQHDTAVVLANRNDVNEASPWIYGLSSSGAIVPQYQPGQAAAVASDIARLRAAHMRIVPSIANVTGGTLSPISRSRASCTDPRWPRQQVNAIVALVHRNNYAGIDIDYEELHAGDRQVFTQFITGAGRSAACPRQGAVRRRVPAGRGPGGGQSNAAQDYAALGKVADQVRIMGYNYHWATSAAGRDGPDRLGPVGARYATSQMPASKVVLGIPLFGYNWPDGNGAAQTVSWLQALRLSRQLPRDCAVQQGQPGPVLQLCRSPDRTHIVWFENAESSKAKFEAVKGNSLAGVYLWMYGYEDPATWSALRAVAADVGPGRQQHVEGGAVMPELPWWFLAMFVLGVNFAIWGSRRRDQAGRGPHHPVGA